MIDAKIIEATKRKIGKQLAEKRKQKKLTLIVAGEKAGMSNSTINAIEKGRGAYTVNSLIAYCHALEIEMFN